MSTAGDARAAELRAAVSRLRRELAAHPAMLRDRGAAEDELAALDALIRAGEPEVSRLRRSLLLLAGAVGSVSALAPALGEVRAAVDSFGTGAPRGVGAAADAPGEVPLPRRPLDDS
ncbi:DUF5955 family protein [Streptomyces gamaensis]|uniref:DUF5955 family protein n=1 Tax=Streptomyces gamaensis TaxID=1763542 RepID=A0ABW0YRN1_9ACTN